MGFVNLEWQFVAILFVKVGFSSSAIVFLLNIT